MSQPLPSSSFGSWPASLQWLVLVSTAALGGQLLAWIGLPAAHFLGPMLVAIYLGVHGLRVRITRYPFQLSQGCIGILLAHSISLSVLGTLADSWFIIVLATLLTISLSGLVSLGLARFTDISSTTALWGMAPGAASAMVSLAEEHGADARAVATMQYVRVVCVVVLGSLVSHLFGIHEVIGQVQTVPLPEHQGPLNLALILAVVLLGLYAGSRIPAGALLLPMLIGGALQLVGVLHINLPDWMLALAYGTIGCYVGLRFDRATIQYIWRRLPAIVASTLVLIALCAVSAWGIAHLLDKDFLSVYLATSPGGLDAMAIIAIDTHADVGLVLAMQTLRLFCVVLLSIFLTRQLIRMTGSGHKQQLEKPQAKSAKPPPTAERCLHKTA